MAKHTASYVASPTINVMLPDGINVSIDPVSDVLYVKVREAAVERTSEAAPGILVDLDRNGGLIGISIISPRQISVRRRTVFRRIAARYHLPSVGRIRPEHLARGYAYAPA